MCGTIYFNTSTNKQFLIKSRQKGPDGNKGQAGEPTVRIAECELDTTTIIATCPIINVRIGCESNTILTTCSDINNGTCVEKVTFTVANNNISDKVGTEAVFAAAQVTISDCKTIHQFKPSLKEDDFDDLELLNWEPQPGCLTRRHYTKQNFNWVARTTNAKCAPNAKWYDSLMNPRSGKYLQSIVIPPQPPVDQCCQDDFFYCPNVQTGGCPPTGL